MKCDLCNLPIVRVKQPDSARHVGVWAHSETLRRTIAASLTYTGKISHDPTPPKEP